eukprot:scaffold3466_cov132-Isochrysis_galbana.AAC.3
MAPPASQPCPHEQHGYGALLGLGLRQPRAGGLTAAASVVRFEQLDHLDEPPLLRVIHWRVPPPVLDLLDRRLLRVQCTQPGGWRCGRRSRPRPDWLRPAVASGGARRRRSRLHRTTGMLGSMVGPPPRTTACGRNGRLRLNCSPPQPGTGSPRGCRGRPPNGAPSGRRSRRGRSARPRCATSSGARARDSSRPSRIGLRRAPARA